MKLTVKPARRLHGNFRLPPDSALAQRAALLSVLCTGKSTINNWPGDHAAAAALECASRLGAGVTPGRQVVQIDGRKSPETAAVELNCTGAHTTFWLTAGLLAGQRHPSLLVGDVPSALRATVVESLRNMGATIEISGDGETILKFKPAVLPGSSIKTGSLLPSAKDAVLMASLFASSPTAITEELPLPDSLERVLPAYGVEPAISHPERPLSRREQILSAAGPLPDLDKFHKRIEIIPSPTPLRPVDWVLPGDFDLAAPLVAAASVRRGSEIIIEDVALNPTRTGLLKVLRRMGAEIITHKRRMENGEPVGDIEVIGDILKATKISPSEIPSVAGQLPLIAVAAGSAVGVTVIRGAKELQDLGLLSLSTITENLRRMGVKVAELEDGWAIEGPTEWHAAEIDCRGDVAVGMAFAIAGLSGEKDTIIDNADAVLARFPDFQKILAELA